MATALVLQDPGRVGPALDRDPQARDVFRHRLRGRDRHHHPGGGIGPGDGRLGLPRRVGGESTHHQVQLPHLERGDQVGLGPVDPLDLGPELAGEPLDQLDLDPTRLPAFKRRPRLTGRDPSPQRPSPNPVECPLGVPGDPTPGGEQGEEDGKEDYPDGGREPERRRGWRRLDPAWCSTVVVLGHRCTMA
jgi:hypothetical protein